MCRLALGHSIKIFQQRFFPMTVFPRKNFLQYNIFFTQYCIFFVREFFIAKIFSLEFFFEIFHWKSGEAFH